MLKKYCLLLTLILLPLLLKAENDVFWRELSDISEQAFQDNLLQALEMAENIKIKYPGHPACNLYKAACLEKLQSDYITNYGEKEFKQTIVDGLKNADEYLKKNRSAEAYFFYGALKGYQAMHSYRTKKNLSAFFTALSAVKNLKKALAKDPEYVDACYGLGVYQYWKAEILPLLKSKAKKEKGKKFLRKAITEGTLTRIEAACSLLRILNYEKKYDEAAALIDETIADYPGSLFMNRFKCRILLKQEEWEKTLVQAEFIQKELLQKSYSGKMLLFEVLYYKSLALYNMDKKQAALKGLQQAIDIFRNKPYGFRSYSKRYKKAEQLLLKIQKS